jgi:hypothetical protein
MKTPSPKVLAAKWVMNRLNTTLNQDSLEPDRLSQLFDSRVSPEKAKKVREQAEKMIKKFVERTAKAVDKYLNPAPSAAQKAKVPPGRKTVKA